MSDQPARHVASHHGQAEMLSIYQNLRQAPPGIRIWRALCYNGLDASLCGHDIVGDDPRSPLEFRLCGRLGCRGGGLALVSVRLCRTHFQALNETKPMQQQPIPSLWPSIVVLACVPIVARPMDWFAERPVGY